MAAVHELFARARAGGHQVMACFCDFADAYTSVDRPAMFALLRQVGVPETFVRVLETTHANLALKVRHNGESSATVIRPRSGVIQGDPLSPFLFILVMDAILRRLPYNAGALCDWRIQLRLPCLAYADDVVLLANSVPALHALIAAFEDAAGPWGLRLNTAPGKTEIISVPHRTRVTPLPCVAGSIRIAQTYKYLGVVLGVDRRAWQTDWSRRVGLAMASLNKFQSVWNSDVSPATKSALVHALVTPILTYGALTYPMSKAVRQKMHVAMSRVLRGALRLRIRWDAPDLHAHTEEVYEHAPFLQVTLTKTLLSAYGHWLRHGMRQAPAAPPILLVAEGAWRHQTAAPGGFRALLETLIAPLQWDAFVALALTGGPAFSKLVRAACRRQFSMLCDETVKPRRLGDRPVARATWSALWTKWVNAGGVDLT
jgi:hypothetical protein